MFISMPTHCGLSRFNGALFCMKVSVNNIPKTPWYHLYKYVNSAELLILILNLS